MHRFSGILALLAATALVASGCGGGDDPGPTPGKGKRGGELTALSLGDISSLDPGYWYYAYDYAALWQTTQRALYGYEPDAAAPRPDLATALPKTSAGGKTVTIAIKPGIRYSPPLQDRVVKSADVKYAIERTFLASVANAYHSVYYADIVGAKAYEDGKADEISGIETPDDTTLVLKLRRPVGVISNARSLALPATIPVPEDYAAPFDKKSESTYGRHQVFVGPYMVANDGKGNLTGYKATRSLELVRNPSWKASTDYRPAYLDTIVFRAGNDINVASRRILSGQDLVNGDFATPPVNILRTAVASRRDQLAIVPAGGNRFIALNTTVKPFDNVNVRRAASAAIDRTALRLTRGGSTLGPIATHYLPPGMPGFEEGGGMAGTFAFAKNPRADLKLAAEYMKKAGYASGKYSGPKLSMVSLNEPPSSTTSRAVLNQLEKLGFQFDYREVDFNTLIGSTCGSSEAHIAVCPSGAWQKDFYDPQSMIDPVFNGKNIASEQGPNWSQVDDPELNAELDLAVSETDEAERAKIYGELDRQVTSQAYVITWIWDDQINIRSEDVNGVASKFTAAWDLTYTSVK